MFTMFKELKWFIKKEWYKYFLIIIFTIIFTYALTIPPKYIGIVIDLITTNGLTFATALDIVFIVLGSTLLIYLAAIFKNYLTGKLFHNLFYKIRNRFMRSIFVQMVSF